MQIFLHESTFHTVLLLTISSVERIKRKSSSPSTSSWRALTFFFKVRYFCLKEFRFTFAFLNSCFAKIRSLLRAAIRLCFLGLSMSNSLLTSLSSLSSASTRKKPVVVLITPFFGFGKLCEITFFFEIGTDEVGLDEVTIVVELDEVVTVDEVFTVNAVVTVDTGHVEVVVVDVVTGRAPLTAIKNRSNEDRL